MTIDTPLDPAIPAARAEPAPPAAQPGRWTLRRPWWQWVAGAVVVAAVAARFVARSHLWLDEAMTVNIARLPVTEIPGALRHDGAPPLYYLLLHGWMKVFGSGTEAVRALSAVFAVGALPLAWWAGERLGGRRVASAALVLFAVSPFALQYATEARMYSLVMLLVLAGGLALAQLLEQATVRSTVALALLTGALLLTHYWAVYLIAAVAALLMWWVVKGRRRQPAIRALVALAAGGLCFVPWLPVLLFQMQHTGAPWGGPPSLRAISDTVWIFATAYRPAGPESFLLLTGLLVLGVFGHALDRRRLELDLLGREPGRTLAAVAFGALTLGVVAGIVTGDAYAHRYASVVFPLVVLVAALGVAVLLDRRVRHAVLAAAIALGVLGAVPIMANERTQAPVVARALEGAARPGDVVVYCPDQLGPSVSRLLPAGLDQITFPRAGPPQFVDWVDYAETNAAARPRPFARMVVDRAGPTGDVWLVWTPGYNTFGRKCETLRRQLDDVRPERRVVRANPVRFPEEMNLTRFPAQP